MSLELPSLNMDREQQTKKRSADELEEKMEPTVQPSDDHAKKAKKHVLSLREVPSE